MTSREFTLFFAWALLDSCRKTRMAALRSERWSKRNPVSGKKKAAQLRSWRIRNPELAKNSNRAYAIRHPKQFHKTKIACRKSGQPRRNILEKERYLTDPSFRLEKCLRARLFAALKGKTKSASTLTLVGCNTQALWQHLEAGFEPGMTRENHGRGVWSVDHIRPCASFDLNDPEQQKQCFHFSNLQPLWESDNIKKGAKCGS